MMRAGIVVFALLLFINSMEAIDFRSEGLRLSLVGENFSVTGFYRFENNTPDSTQAAIYFPIDTDFPYGKYRLLKLQRVIGSPGTECRLGQLQEHGFSFLLTMPAYSAMTVMLCYRQPVYNGKAKYILTTAALWGKALETSDIRFRLQDQSQAKISFNLPPDYLHRHGKETIASWSFEQFRPTQDWELEINRPK